LARLPKDAIHRRIQQHLCGFERRSNRMHHCDIASRISDKETRLSKVTGAGGIRLCRLFFVIIGVASDLLGSNA
jgi:hypothetical protein